MPVLNHILSWYTEFYTDGSANCERNATKEPLYTVTMIRIGIRKKQHSYVYNFILSKVTTYFLQ